MKATLIGKVTGYTEDETGAIHLVIEEAQVSAYAESFVQNERRMFNPSSPNQGYGARDVPCNVMPGFATYRYTVAPDQIRGISFGSEVEVELDLFNFRRPKFYNKRWSGFAELRSELVNIRLRHQGNAHADGKGGKSDGK